VIWVGEYTSNKFCELFGLDETIHQNSCIDTSEQNGIVERKHRYIVEIIYSLLLSAFVPGVFYGEVVLTVVGLINTILSSYILGISPFEKLYGYAPDYSFFKMLGCTCFIFHPHIEHSKLLSRPAICVSIGYGECQKRYRCFDLITHKLYMSHHVIFLEHIPLFSISSIAHSLTRSNLIYIDLFFFRILIVYYFRFLILQIPLLMLLD